MNRRATIQLLIVLLLILLLGFWGLGSLENKRVVRRGPSFDSGLKDAPLPIGEAIMEEQMELSKSPAEQAKAVVEPISHSGWENSGAYEVFGEAQNMGVAVAKNVRAHVFFKNGNWDLLGEVEARVDKPTLAPGEKSAFKVRLPIDDPRKVGSYVVIMVMDR